MYFFSTISFLSIWNTLRVWGREFDTNLRVSIFHQKWPLVERQKTGVLLLEEHSLVFQNPPNKYLLRRSERTPFIGFLRRCLGFQTPTHKVFGTLGIEDPNFRSSFDKQSSKTPGFPSPHYSGSFKKTLRISFSSGWGGWLCVLIS